jgi:hypothetical protein
MSRKNLPLLILPLLAIILILVFSAPRALAFYHQITGGKYLSQALASSGSTGTLTDYCYPPEVNESARTLAKKARGHLERSLDFYPNFSHTYLQLGRVNCFLQNPKNAVKSYAGFTQRRPENPLGYIELALAYEAYCRLEAVNQLDESEISKVSFLCPERKALAALREAWKNSRTPPKRLLTLATQAFVDRDFAQANLWYRHAILTNKEVPNEALFWWEIAHQLTGGSPFPEELAQINIRPLTGTLQIEGEDLQWNTAKPEWNTALGDRIGVITQDDLKAGIMWWNGNVIVLVQVIESGDYRITIRAQNTPPPPVQFQLEKDLIAVTQFELARGDGSFENLTAETSLSKGIHLIGIRYLNDGSEDGIDRNLVIDWIEIQEAP